MTNGNQKHATPGAYTLALSVMAKPNATKTRRCTVINAVCSHSSYASSCYWWTDIFQAHFDRTDPSSSHKTLTAHRQPHSLRVVVQTSEEETAMPPGA